MQKRPSLQEVLPKSGLVVSEKGGLSELLCKPKLLPLKSISLQKLEEMEVSISSTSTSSAASADEFQAAGIACTAEQQL
jgi:BBSome-interacting protein 1